MLEHARATPRRHAGDYENWASNLPGFHVASGTRLSAVELSAISGRHFGKGDLEHEAERRAIADAARAVVERFTFAKLWQGQVGRIAELLPTLQERVHRRLAERRPVDLTGRVWQALGSSLPKTD